jgi:uncharacterized protein YndB with AHSA1/START domain
LAGDVATVTATIGVDAATAFDVFTSQIDQWWRRGPRFRNAPGDSGMLYLEPKVGGRLFESVRSPDGETVIEIGCVLEWSPPSRLVFKWRNSNFAPGESTHVEIRFDPCTTGTRVTVRHSGLSSLRPDHPARHGLAPSAYVRMIGLWWGDLLSALIRSTHAVRGT